MNARDEAIKVLVSEMLGDLDALRSHVDALPAAIQASIAGATQRAERAAASIQRATDALIVAGTRHQSSINEYIEHDVIPRINRATGKALADIAASVEGTSDATRKEPPEPAQVAPDPRAFARASGPGNRASWWVAIGFSIGIIAGVAGTVAWLRPA